MSNVVTRVFQNHAIKIVPVFDSAHTEVFGAKLSTPTPMAGSDVSPIVSNLEAKFGTSSAPLKISAAENLLRVLGEIGPLSRVESINQVSPVKDTVLETRLNRLQGLSNRNSSNFMWQPSEVATLPKSDVSRSMAKTATNTMRFMNGVGFAIISYEGLRALKNGNFGEFLITTHVGFVLGLGFEFGLKSVALAAGSATIASWVPVALAVGATAYWIKQATTRPEDRVSWGIWFGNMSSELGTAFRALLQTPSGKGLSETTLRNEKKASVQMTSYNPDGTVLETYTQVFGKVECLLNAAKCISIPETQYDFNRLSFPNTSKSVVASFIESSPAGGGLKIAIENAIGIQERFSSTTESYTYSFLPEAKFGDQGQNSNSIRFGLVPTYPVANLLTDIPSQSFDKDFLKRTVTPEQFPNFSSTYGREFVAEYLTMLEGTAFNIESLVGLIEAALVSTYGGTPVPDELRINMMTPEQKTEFFKNNPTYPCFNLPKIEKTFACPKGFSGDMKFTQTYTCNNGYEPGGYSPLIMNSNNCFEQAQELPSMRIPEFPAIDMKTAQSYISTPPNPKGIKSCSLDKSLPKGLGLNYKDCSIRGTPKVVSPPTQYTVTARNDAGSFTQTFNLQITSAMVPGGKQFSLALQLQPIEAAPQLKPVAKRALAKRERVQMVLFLELMYIRRAV